MRRLSESTTLATPLLLYHFSTVSVSGWLNGNRQQRDRGLAESGVVQNFCELIRHHTSMEKRIQQKALLTIGKEKPWVRRYPSKSARVVAKPTFSCLFSLLVSGCLQIFIAEHLNTNIQRVG
uniref:Secreted protein n=1 Tax=Mesocestoides corti TaxID=53468 RepID=A0A5K3FYI2_MESCO